MIRVLKCQEGDSDKFDLCWMAIHLGRVLLLNDAQGRQSRDERRRDLAILRAFKAASGPADAKADKLQTGEDQRVMTVGSELRLQQIEFDRLIALIDRVGWVTAKLELVEDTIDWLMASERKEQ